MQFTDLLLNSSIVAKFILGVLIIISVLSWGYIFSKWASFRRAKRLNQQFLDAYWSSNDLVAMYNGMNGQPKGGMARIFYDGMHDFLQDIQQRPGYANLTAIERAMEVTIARETTALKRHMNFLASAGSVSPYIGLLGTVWGVMTSFIGLSGEVQNTIASVAPGIAEALIATAVGLFAAIPAVLAYNYFANQIDTMGEGMENFMDEFMNVLHRQVQVNTGATHA